jgi:CheY-like chemotaxis protein
MVPAEVAPPTVAVSPSVATVPDVGPTSPLPAPQRKTILVVDDDPATLDMLQRFLGKEGYDVVPVARGKDVLAMAREVHPQAITLDLLMPGMDGWSVLAALKDDPELAEIPVILLTIVEDRNLAHAFGVTDYLTKPIDRTRLLSILQKYVQAPSSGLALIVEDDPNSRNLFRQLLERDGWSVIEAGNGREAMVWVERRQPALIVLDLMMPEVDGFEFLTQLRRHPTRQSIPVLVVTAKDLTAEDRLFLNGGMLLGGRVQGIVQKGSFSQEELLREVHKLMGSRELVPAKRAVS